jgi:hypothetical protein
MDYYAYSKALLALIEYIVRFNVACAGSSEI